MHARTWRWFTVRLFGLSRESRLWTALRAQLTPSKPTGEVTKAQVDAIVRR